MSGIWRMSCAATKSVGTLVPVSVRMAMRWSFMGPPWSGSFEEKYT